MLARAAHEASGRTGPFVAVNCGAIPEALVESELFGVRKGAFSGAHVDRAGAVLAAHDGTLFLDEVAELPESSQAALLRVLQEAEVVLARASTRKLARRPQPHSVVPATIPPGCRPLAWRRRPSPGSPRRGRP